MSNKKLKRLALKKEPVLHVHNYICAIHTSNEECVDTDFKYVLNLKEVEDLKKKLKPGQVIEVFRATHNFIKAFEKR